jgi:hypothetical protein
LHILHLELYKYISESEQCPFCILLNPNLYKYGIIFIKICSRKVCIILIIVENQSFKLGILYINTKGRSQFTDITSQLVALDLFILPELSKLHLLT